MAVEVADESLGPHQFQHRHQMPVALAQWPQFLGQGRKKFALKALPIIG